MTALHSRFDPALPIQLFGAALDIAMVEGKPVAPEWITLFPKTGPVTARDGRALDVDADALIATFTSQKLSIPIDVNHATEKLAPLGGRADAVGWIVELALKNGAVMGRVEWLDRGTALVTSKRYRYTSPAVFSDVSTGRTTWIKSVALVTAPALANQPTLHAAQSKSELSMKTVLTVLGLAEAATEAECLAAVQTLKTNLADAVPKLVHDKVVQQLSAASTELDALKTAGHKAKVEGLLDGALKAKKIVPAEKAGFEALCATPEGLAQVEKLFAVKAPQLESSGLDHKQVQTGERTPEQLAAAANKLQAEAASAGRVLSIADAVGQVVHGDAAA